MPDVAYLTQDALEELVDVRAEFIVGGPPPSWLEVLSDYSNSEIADAAGYRTASGHRPRAGSQRWRDYRALMQDLSRYRRGVRHPDARRVARLERLGLKIKEREAEPHSIGEVLRLIRRHGVTVTYLAGVVRISADESYREVLNVFCRPSSLTDNGFHLAAERAASSDSPVDWLRAFEALFRTWRDAYGVPGFVLDELLVLELAIGRQPDEMGGHRGRPEGEAA